jgi:hypothetical protein
MPWSAVTTIATSRGQLIGHAGELGVDAGELGAPVIGTGSDDVPDRVEVAVVCVDDARGRAGRRSHRSLERRLQAGCGDRAATAEAGEREPRGGELRPQHRHGVDACSTRPFEHRRVGLEGGWRDLVASVEIEVLTLPAPGQHDEPAVVARDRHRVADDAVLAG